MQSSGTGRRNERGRRARGFTLIELIVVVSIVSVLALALGLTTAPVIERNRPGSAGPAAGALAVAVEAARERAFHHRQSAGLVPRPGGWVLVTRAADGNGWEPAESADSPGGSLQWEIDGSRHTPPAIAPDADTEPPILFLGDGRATPFRVTLSGRGGAAHVCATDGLEPLTCRAR